MKEREERLIFTEPDKCTKCYACIRVCPVHANKVYDDYVEPVPEYCIKCGTCVLHCEPGARKYRWDVDVFKDWVKNGEYLCAILAPAYVAEWKEVKVGQLASALKKIGFKEVHEVAFGAELTTLAVIDELKEGKLDRIITSPCPSLINYIEKWQPELIPYFSRAYSPMLATAAFIRHENTSAKIVFVSPCIAKKDEIIHEDVKGLVDLVLTFQEIKALFEEYGISPELEPEELLDGCQPHVATLFPVTGGLTRTAMEYLKGEKLEDPLLEEDLLITEGRERAIPFLKEFGEKLEKGETEVLPRLVDILYCEGCIDGPATRRDVPLFEKRRAVIKYTKERLPKKSGIFGKVQAKRVAKRVVSLKETKEIYSKLNLFRNFVNRKVKYEEPPLSYIEEVLKRTNRFGNEINCGACGYPTCRDRAIAAYNGLIPEDLCVIYKMEEVNELLAQVKEEQEKSRKVIEKASDVLNDISLLVSDVANQAINLSENATLIAQESEKGQGMVGELADRRRLMQRKTDTIVRSIDRLKEESEKLVPILNMIAQVADQTSLLALNASIEAARAGEAGRGFSVIAQEVRKLAEGTKTYSEEVENTIRQMSQIIKEVVEGVSDMIETMVDEGKVVENSVELFQSILAKVENLSEGIQNLTGVAEEMSANVDQIRNSIEEILKSV